jgi:ubiquinone biosynthesis protein UbiJ
MASPNLLTPFESLLNRNIAASTPARGQLAALAGRSFAIESGVPAGPSLRVRLAASTDAISLTRDDVPADATVTGTPFALLAMLARRADGQGATAGVTIRGDAEVAQLFERLIRHARPDLEEELARVLGDVPGHFAARFARGAIAWTRAAGDSFARNIGEYLTEESRDLVPRSELEPLLDGIDRAREDVDRAEARVALLERKLAGSR